MKNGLHEMANDIGELSADETGFVTGGIIGTGTGLETSENMEGTGLYSGNKDSDITEVVEGTGIR